MSDVPQWSSFRVDSRFYPSSPLPTSYSPVSSSLPSPSPLTPLAARSPSPIAHWDDALTSLTDSTPLLLAAPPYPSISLSQYGYLLSTATTSHAAHAPSASTTTSHATPAALAPHSGVQPGTASPAPSATSSSPPPSSAPPLVKSSFSSSSSSSPPSSSSSTSSVPAAESTVIGQRPIGRRQLTRKAKQRAVNANRRQREITAIQRLALLTPTTVALTDARADVAETDEPDTEQAVEESEWRTKRSRAEILEDSARKIEQLEEVVRFLARQQQPTHSLLHSDDNADGCTAHNQSTAASFPFSTSRSALLGAGLSRLSAALGSSSLDCRCFVAGGPGVMLVVKSVVNGALLDISRASADVFGFQREQMIGRGLSTESTYTTIMGSEQQQEQQQQSVVDLLLPVTTSHGDQYPATTLGMRELYAGRASRVEVSWRFMTRDGSLYEAPCVCWCGPRDEHGKLSTVAFLSSLDQIIKVDPWAGRTRQQQRRSSATIHRNVRS